MTIETKYTIQASYNGADAFVRKAGGQHWTGDEWMPDNWEPDAYATIEEAQQEARYLPSLPEGWEVYIVETAYDADADEFTDVTHRVAS